MKTPPGVACIEGLKRLRKRIADGELKLPIPGILLDTERAHSFVLKSVKDIKITPLNKGSPHVLIRCDKDGEILVTPDKYFSIKIGRDAEGKAIFLFLDLDTDLDTDTEELSIGN